MTIGRVTDDRKLRVWHDGAVVAEIPNLSLTAEAPRYDRPKTPPEQKHRHHESAQILSRVEGLISDHSGDRVAAFTGTLRRLLARPNLASKHWVYRQYDHMVRTNTVVLPGSDAAVIRVKETRRSLAMSLDGNGRYCAIDPRAGARLAVVEAARNVVCSGARPLAITNCLNFASPERPEVMHSFSETIDGLSEACRALGTPVTGGNVSFYNETEGQGIYPTPVVGMLGVIEDPRNTTTQWFKESGDKILLLGEPGSGIGASELEAMIIGEDPAKAGSVPELDLDAEIAVQRACLEAIEAGLVRSAHDCADGGLAVALAECCFSQYGAAAIGAEVDLGVKSDELLPDALALLFGEAPSRIILSVRTEDVAEVESIAGRAGTACRIDRRSGREPPGDHVTD